MISITLHRNSYPTLISADVATLLRDRGRGSMSASDYRGELLARFQNLGQGAGYSSGDIWVEEGVQYPAMLHEVFNQEIGAFILRVKR